ncbi:MAG: hypothetical protein UV01_C0002G0091 [Parcubacteria group bacterium GW2011_GWA2_42_14]|nr:MAG: hypothetical protein UV01_C0002G0091 [Parcubacteria group bacterium GW2011_GWA2_42_14]
MLLFELVENFTLRLTSRFHSKNNYLQMEQKLSKNDIRSLTRIFYSLIGVTASLALFFIFYVVLSVDSSITSLVNNTKNEPLYLWLYFVFTAGAIVIFGFNVVLLVHGWRKYGKPNFRWKAGEQAGTGLGTLLGVVASACPICGSTILAAIGIAGGLAVFPLAGLELKALSFGLMGFSSWLAISALKKHKCDGEKCPAPHNFSFKDSDRPWLIFLLAAFSFLVFLSWNMVKSDPIIAQYFLNAKAINVEDSQLFDWATERVLPQAGFRSKIYLGGSIIKLVENGVIDSRKFEELYKDRGGMPKELKNILAEPSSKPIVLTRDNANLYINLLWPLGLANQMSTNEQSPVVGKSLFNFASTGGWTLGKAENGGEYFNKFKIVELTRAQEELATKVAKNTYRPCCNNSTFFQDCNHGSALLGLLELGASQGLTEDELYREALAFNSFWFPQNYIQTAVYFKAVKNIDWEKVDPKIVMGKDFSSSSGWRKNVGEKLANLGLVPKAKAGGAGCGV